MLANVSNHFALLKFKEFIANDPYGILSSRNDSIHFCNWHGITCGRRHERVTTLELEGYKLSGFITPNIGNLLLRKINLRNNNFFVENPHGAWLIDQDFFNSYKISSAAPKNTTSK